MNRINLQPKVVISQHLKVVLFILDIKKPAIKRAESLKKDLKLYFSLCHDANNSAIPVDFEMFIILVKRF